MEVVANIAREGSYHVIFCEFSHANSTFISGDVLIRVIDTLDKTSDNIIFLSLCVGIITGSTSLLCSNIIESCNDARQTAYTTR